jgi:hypothetical protein
MDLGDFSCALPMERCFRVFLSCFMLGLSWIYSFQLCQLCGAPSFSSDVTILFQLCGVPYFSSDAPILC